jgi:putative addiction module component (TIGR02574 family)
MNKIDEAWQAFKRLAPEEQERLADVILNFAAYNDSSIQLSDEQVADIERRLADQDDQEISLDEFRARVKALGT